MAFFFQLRNIKREVQQQLDGLSDTEKHLTLTPNGNWSTVSSRRSNSEQHVSGDQSAWSSDSSSETLTGDLYSHLPGIEHKVNEDGSTYYLVTWAALDGPDPKDPHNWSMWHRLKTTLLLFLLTFTATAASSIDSAVAESAAKEFGVAPVTEALGGTGIFLIGFGVGALLCAPLSEFVGRYPTYVGSLAIFAVWLMASALSPNIGAQIVFRGLAGLCSSAPLTVAGGTMSDLWNPKEKTWAFPLFAIAAFGGPVIGPVIGAYIGYKSSLGSITWRWADWVMLIADGVVVLCVFLFKEETLAPRLLKYRAHYLRKLTGDSRFKSASEATGQSLTQIFRRNFGRPFILALEPIVLFLTFYLTIIYIILFTFLDGYTYIFADVYGINSGLTFTIFVALFVGILCQFLVLPFVYRLTVKQLERDGDEGKGLKIDRESRLWFAMIGAPTVPIGLFWMAWTDYKHISIWSPILSSVLFGFGIISVFLSSYMFVIDSYEVNAASALTFVTLVRYIIAGGMTVVGVPMYENLGTHYTLTILACISAAAVPIPYALFKWGPKIRAKSQYAVSPGT